MARITTIAMNSSELIARKIVDLNMPVPFLPENLTGVSAYGHGLPAGQYNFVTGFTDRAA
jgi:hypothetical protein